MRHCYQRREYCASYGPTAPPESGATCRKQMKIRATHSPEYEIPSASSGRSLVPERANAGRLW